MYKHSKCPSIDQEIKSVPPYNMILFSNRKDFSSDTCYDPEYTQEPWKYDAKNERLHTVWSHLYSVSRRPMETQNGLVVD